MLLPAFVTHKSLLSSTVSPQGELNSLGKSKISKDLVSKLYRKICPLYPYIMMETHTAFSFSSVNQISASPSSLRLSTSTSHTCENSIGFSREGHNGICFSSLNLFS